MRLKQLQDELKVAEEQLVHFSEEADDARIRSLVSETPLADQKHREANKHAESMRSYKNNHFLTSNDCNCFDSQLCAFFTFIF